MNGVILIRPLIQTALGIILISLAIQDKALTWEYQLGFTGIGIGMILFGWVIFKRDLERKKRQRGPSNDSQQQE